MVFRGTIHNGKVILDDPQALPEGLEVDVTPSRTKRKARPARKGDTKRRAGGRSPSPGRTKQPTVLDSLRPFIGSLQGLPKDAAANVDRYLYGDPKNS